MGQELRKYEQAVYDRTTDKFTKRDLAIAWLQFMTKNGLHPDDTLLPGGGWCGWHVILAYQVTAWLPGNGLDEASDELLYPNFLSEIPLLSLPSLKAFHADDPSGQEDCIKAVGVLAYSMVDIIADELPEIIAALETLCLYHTDGPEEVVEPLHAALRVSRLIAALD